MKMLRPFFPVIAAALALCAAAPASGQTAAAAPAATLVVPGKPKPAQAAKPTAAAASPRAPVHPAKPTPVVRPQGQTHAKPVKKTVTVEKPGAKAAAAGAAAAAATVTPAVPAEAPAELAKGSSTGMVLPRFAALRSDEVNLRAGPGTRYPIDWVYKRRDLPVRIEREFEVWRLVADQEGVKGWVHQATLTGRRSFVVTGAERTLHNKAAADSSAVAMLMPGVVGQIRSCETTTQWCQLQTGDYRGWLKRDEFWGVLPGEVIK